MIVLDVGEQIYFWQGVVTGANACRNSGELPQLSRDGACTVLQDYSDPVILSSDIQSKSSTTFNVCTLQLSRYTWEALRREYLTLEPKSRIRLFYP